MIAHFMISLLFSLKQYEICRAMRNVNETFPPDTTAVVSNVARRCKQLVSQQTEKLSKRGHGSSIVCRCDNSSELVGLRRVDSSHFLLMPVNYSCLLALASISSQSILIWSLLE